jgi:hypothetical protein
VGIDSVDRSSVNFYVCDEDALNLAGGNRELADAIINGWVMLHEMPRALFGGESAEARTAWLREKVDAYRATAPVLASLDDLENL